MNTQTTHGFSLPVFNCINSCITNRITSRISKSLVLILTFLSLGVGTVWADYTITFKSASGDSDGTAQKTAMADIIDTGDSYVESVTASTIYWGASGKGIKFGSGNAGGSLTITLSDGSGTGKTNGRVKAAKIICIGGLVYSTDGTELTYGVTFSDGTSTKGYALPTTAANDTLTLSTADAAKTITSITLSTPAKKKRGYVQAVKVIEASETTCTSEVNVTKGSETYGTYSLSAAKVCADGDGGTITISDISPVSGYQFKEITTSASGTVSGYTVTGIKAATTITVIFEPIPTYTANWYVNNPSTPAYYQTDVAGTALTGMPTPTKSDCDNQKVFVGWTTESTFSGTTEQIAAIIKNTSGMTMPVGGANYYAVFAKEGSGGATTLLSEDFSALTSGDNTSTNNQSTSWSGNSNFTSTTKAYQAGGAVKLGASGGGGNITTKTLTVDANKGITVAFDVKGWTSVEGDIVISVDGCTTDSTKTYTATMSDSFESISVTFPTHSANPQVTIGTSAKRAFLDNVVITTGGVSYSEYTISCGPSVSITPNSLTAERPNTGTVNVTATGNLFTPTSWTWGTSDANVATVSGSGASATVTYKGAGTCTISCEASGGGTTATGYCSVTVPTSFTISLVDNGTTTNVTNRVAGDKLTLPSGASTCPDYHFLGWVTSDYTNGTATAPTGIVEGEQTLSGATTYYAVYSFEDIETKSYKPTNDVSKLVDGVRVAIYCSNPKFILQTDGTGLAYSDAITTSTSLTSLPLNQIWTVKSTGDGSYPHALYNGSQYLSVASEEENALVTLSDAMVGWNITGTYVSDNTVQIEKTGTLDLNFNNGNWQIYTYSHASTHLWVLLETYATTYTKQPTCGPTIKADGEPYITSANGLTIQAVDSIDVYGTMLTSASTLSASSNNAKFTAVLKSNTITDGKITTKLAIKYTPTSANVADETATITLEDNLNLASTTITVHGRSLPNSFVIVAKDANDIWRAVPSNMPEASTYVGIPTDVDSDSDPAAADRTAINTHYYLSTACTTPATGATYSRYDSVPWTVRFVGDNDKCLYGAKSGNQIYNGVSVSTAKQPYEWILLTNDNETYFIKSNNNNNDRSLCMNTSNQIGLYASGEKQFRILPYTNRCYYFAQPTTLGASSVKSTTAKIQLDSIPYAKQYQYKVNGASTWTTVPLSSVEYMNPATSKQILVPVSGLTGGIQNTILIRGTDTSVDDADLCAPNPGVEYLLTTTLCDYVVNLGTPIPSATTATLTWTMDGFTCNSFIIRLYSDEACTIQEGSDIAATGSPHVVTGLTESTQYYYRVYAAETGVAAPGCPSAIGEFMTKNPSVEIMTWHPEQVDIAVNINGTPVIMLMDEVTHGEEGSGKLADDIFFSKYYEAARNVKLLGIYNGTADTVDLSKYQIWQSSNGKKTQNSWMYKTTITNLEVKSGPTTSVPTQLPPSKELILISFQDGNSDAEVTECAQNNKEKSGYDNYYRVRFRNPAGDINFSGDDPVALYYSDSETSTYRMVDLIGAGTESHDSISVTGQPYSFMDDKGYYTPNGTDTLGKGEYKLSTNRCLLIRKNTVYAGYNTTNQGANNAVDLNKKDFVTLGDHDGVEGEWFGVQIPNLNPITGADDGGIKSSCIGFDWVGGYNYTDYYKKFETVVDSTKLDTIGVNDDGTYIIHIDTLFKMSCSRLKVQVYANPGDKKPSVENMYKVPIMIYDGDKTTSDELFTKHGNKVCKECDVIIRDNKTLSTSSTGVDSVGHITVYEGSKLDLTAKALNAASLTLRSRQDNVSSAYIPYNTSLKDVNGDGGQPNVYFEKYISDEDWHWITVPYPVNVSEITFTDNTSCVYRTDFWIKWYDGEARADNPTQADGRNWKHLDPATTPQLLPGVGYIVAIADQKVVKDGKRQWKALRFPMVGYDEASGKNVAVKAYGAGSEYVELKPNNKGWNLVGNPYLSYYNGFNNAAPLQTGKLEVYYDSEGQPYYDYDSETTSLYYVTIPQNAGKSEYKQELVTATELPPFTSYFVQIAGVTKNEDKSVMFTAGQRKTSVSRRRYMAEDDEKDNEAVFVGVKLTNAKGESDNTGLCINKQYTQAQYEVGGDLYKWMGTKFTQYTKPVLYSTSLNGNMAFNALSETEAAAVNAVPLSCYTLVDGLYTFSLNEAYDQSRIESVILYDAQSNTYTDLAQESYEFRTAASTAAVDNRFYISAKIRKKPSVATAIGEQTIGNDKVIKFITPDGQLHIARDGVIYDVQGRVEQRLK